MPHVSSYFLCRSGECKLGNASLTKGLPPKPGEELQLPRPHQRSFLFLLVLLLHPSKIKRRSFLFLTQMFVQFLFPFALLFVCRRDNICKVWNLNSLNFKLNDCPPLSAFLFPLILLTKRFSLLQNYTFLPSFNSHVTTAALQGRRIYHCHAIYYLL